MKSNIIFTLVLAYALVTAGGLAAAGDDPHPGGMPKIDCSECHTCSTPTAHDKCLKACPIFSMTHVTAAHKLSEAPDTIILDYLADEYQAVRFDHKAHADMAEMGLQCATCHHYSPEGRIPACRECHGGEANPNNLRQPALKGAYHRHCISCHREWSHNTKCVICHLPAEGQELAEAVDSTDYIGISHPVITEPNKKVYHTPYKQGPVVTFYHKQHIELYGLRCANCHQQENCSYCHDMEKPTRVAKTMEEIHATCNNCHAKDRCSKCHDVKEKPAFSHDLTGWGLNRFHKKLDCRACHPTGKPISRLDSSCDACHAGWGQGNFDHAVTGLTLDEIHIEADCTDCHTDRKFDRQPVCGECHDDGRTTATSLPGEKVTR